MRICDILLSFWLVSSLALAHPQTAAARWIDPESTGQNLEEKLKDHLSKRVLVLREQPLNGQVVEVSGIAKTRKEGETTSGMKAILFTDLSLDSEMLTIRGEAVEPKPGASRVAFHRFPKRLPLVTCRIILNPAVRSLTLAHAFRLLTHVFLTRDELRREFSRMKQEQESQKPQ